MARTAYRLAGTSVEASSAASRCCSHPESDRRQDAAGTG